MAVIPIYIPTYISDQTYKPARVLPRLLFYNGQVECEPYWVQNQLAQQFEQSTFPYFDNYNVVTGSFPTVNSKSLLFYNEEASYGQTPTASLYSEYWSTYLNLLYNPLTKLINASAIIPLADYRELKQNDVVEFRSNYYHLRAINDYNLKNGECTIQLLGPILADSLNLPTKLFFKCFGYDVSDCDVACTDADLCNPTTTTTTSTTSTTTTTTAAPIIYTGWSRCADEPNGRWIIYTTASLNTSSSYKFYFTSSGEFNQYSGDCFYYYPPEFGTNITASLTSIAGPFVNCANCNSN